MFYCILSNQYKSIICTFTYCYYWKCFTYHCIIV